jgi:hypothetical protein
MAGTAVVGAGNYTLEIDTGFIQDAFLLDDPVAGVLDNNLQYVLDGTTNFADVTTGINSVNVKRGRRDVGDQFSAGTMTFNMLDTTGIFNPFDTLSPYFDPATAQPGLHQCVKCAWRAIQARTLKNICLTVLSLTTTTTLRLAVWTR